MPPLSRSHVVSALRSAGCVFAEDEAELILSTARTREETVGMVDRRVAGLPLEHVLGWAEFRGLHIVLDPGVFVPRRRTEFLVEQALALRRNAFLVVDLCCGSGAVGAALAAGLDAPELHAADIDPAAVRCARRNVAAYGGRVHEGDLFAALPDELRGRVDILTANVPYVPTEEVALLPSEARDHEPLVALDGGSDGLDVLRRVTAGAARWLAPGGSLLVETSERQVPSALEAFTNGGLEARLTVSEKLYANVLIGTRC
jgi:release factor glutamine methyltransferase